MIQPVFIHMGSSFMTSRGSTAAQESIRRLLAVSVPVSIVTVFLSIVNTLLLEAYSSLISRKVSAAIWRAFSEKSSLQLSILK